MTRSAASLALWERKWERFLRGGPSPELLGIVRIGFASVVLANSLLVLPYVEAWWSEHGWFPQVISRELTDPHVWSLLRILPATDGVLWTCYGLALAHATMLLLGICSRLNAFAVFVWLVSFQHRNFMVTDGEDTVMRLFSFFLAFTPLGDAYSLEARWRWRERLPPWLRAWLPEPRWGSRFIQIVPAIIVLAAGLEKLDGEVWRRGDALYYVTKLDDLFHAPWLPRFILESHGLLRLATWGALVVEVAAPLLIWFRETRRAALITLVLLHLGMFSMMNLFMFQPLMLLLWSSHATLSELTWVRDKLFRSPLRTLARFFAGTSSPSLSRSYP